MMQTYKGYFIEGDALMVHPFSPDWYVGGSVLVAGESTSLVGITRFSFTSLLWASKNWQNGSGWKSRGLRWTNAWLRDRAA
jgi:hypothetical protein